MADNNKLGASLYGKRLRRFSLIIFFIARISGLVILLSLLVVYFKDKSLVV